MSNQDATNPDDYRKSADWLIACMCNLREQSFEIDEILRTERLETDTLKDALEGIEEASTWLRGVVDILKPKAESKEAA